jgi:hypothetical protein
LSPVLLFTLLRAKVAQAGMTALAIVENHDVVKNRSPRFGTTLKAGESLLVQTCPETFHWGVIPTIAFGIELSQALSVSLAGVLAASVTRVQ